MAAVRALLFDVDGTLAETEEGHRQAFNEVFVASGIPWRWEQDHYRELLRVTGGKERMLHTPARTIPSGWRRSRGGSRRYTRRRTRATPSGSMPAAARYAPGSSG